jgi:isoleucyl-tRNA synthetase
VRAGRRHAARVGDCWLDAGIVPFSTLGYFDDPEGWKSRFPAEWITEMREQVRLWFYSMLFMSVVLEGRAPYERVLSYERVISETGEKFSKTGHMIRFDEAVAEIGADPIRYLFSRQPAGSEARFGFDAGAQAQRTAGLWNIASFFLTYAASTGSRWSAVDTQAALPSPTAGSARTAQLVEVRRVMGEHFDDRAAEQFIEEVSN